MTYVCMREIAPAFSTGTNGTEGLPFGRVLAGGCGLCHPNVQAHVVIDLLVPTINNMMVATVMHADGTAAI